MHRLWPGVPLALLSAVLFGAVAPFAKLFLRAVDAQLLAGLLYLGAGVGLAIVHLARGMFGLPAQEAPLRRHDMPWLAAVILFGGFVAPLMLMLGLRSTSAATGSLLLNLEGVVTLTIAWLVFRENADGRIFAGALAILGGAALLSVDGVSVHFGTGAALIAMACVAWGVDNNLTRKLSSADPVVTSSLKGLVAGAVNLVLALLRGVDMPPSPTIAAASAIGFLGIGVSLVLFIYALRYLGTARASAYFALAPFIGAVLAVAMLNEPLTSQLSIAAGLMGIGLWLHLAERHDHEHDHEAMGHEHAHVHDAHHRHAHDGPVTEPHSHWHQHEPMRHKHVHYPDLHHRHHHG